MLKPSLKRGLAAFGVVAIAAMSAGAATAATVNTKSNVIFLVDESGSMSGEQAFLENTVIDELDSGLAAAGVTDRKYGVVGYGSSTVAPRQLGSGLLNAADTKTELGNLLINGFTEDGYAAIDFALANFSFTSGAAVNFVLVTDEDRDNTNNALTFSSIQTALTDRNILLNAIVSNSFSTGTSTSALGIDSDGDGYVADGSGGFTAEALGIAGSGAGSTTTDYVDLALNTGGAAWDLNQLRAGGLIAESFTTAFLDIKVQEITTQPPTSPIPLPAGAWLMLTGLGAFAAMRRRKKAT